MAVIVETHATLADAAQALGRGDAVFLGGGTGVMRLVNAGTVTGRIVRSTDTALRQVQLSGDTIRIGAGVTMAEIANHRDLAFLHPVARSIGGPAIRAMATVGGNLFAPHPYGDFAVALLALGARAIMAGGESARPLDDLLRERGRGHGQLVAAVEFSRPRDPREFGWLKVSRVKPKGVSVMSIAAHLPREGGRIRGARIAFGAMGPAPLRSAAVERVLDGQNLDEASIQRAAEMAPEGLDPPTDALASTWYRREVAGTHLRRLLKGMA